MLNLQKTLTIDTVDGLRANWNKLAPADLESLTVQELLAVRLAGEVRIPFRGENTDGANAYVQLVHDARADVEEGFQPVHESQQVTMTFPADLAKRILAFIQAQPEVQAAIAYYFPEGAPQLVYIPEKEPESQQEQHG